MSGSEDGDFGRKRGGRGESVVSPRESTLGREKKRLGPPRSCVSRMPCDFEFFLEGSAVWA